jgi:hypothetical protein
MNLEWVHLLSRAPVSFFDQKEIEGESAAEQDIGEGKPNRSIQIPRLINKGRSVLADEIFFVGIVSTIAKPRKSGLGALIPSGRDTHYSFPRYQQ